MGFRFRPPVKRVTCNWVPVPDGEEPLWADISTMLSMQEFELLRHAYKDGTMRELWPAIAPHVTAWNAEARDSITREWVEIAPPSEGGVDALKTQPSLFSSWLAVELLVANSSTTDEDPKAEASPSEPTDAPPPSGDTDSPSGKTEGRTPATNRRRRKTST